MGKSALTDRDTISLRPTQRVGIREFRGNFFYFMRQVRDGSSFMVTSRDEVVAIIQPPYPSEPPQRKAGALRGKIRMSADFDTLPIDILTAMEGDGG
jgi:antitoxin (DNA-binding transcriptional repressor) of toxin-antitoxin stability system